MLVSVVDVDMQTTTSSKSKKIDGVASMITAFGGLLQNPIYNFDVN